MADAREIIHAKEKVIMLNSGPGCLTCERAERALMDAKESMEGEGVVMVKIESSESTELLIEFGIRANGSLVFIKNGEKQASLITHRMDDVLNKYRLHFISQTYN